MILVAGWICLPVYAAANGFQWAAVTPESQGMSTRQLQQLTDTLAAHGTTSLLVIRNDRIIHEWYAPEWGPDRRHYSASLAKALVGGTSLLRALDEGVIYPDAPACYYIPGWKSHPQKSKITVRQLATHTSGIEDAEPTEEEQQRLLEEGVSRTDIHMNLPGWKGIFWRKDPDPFTVSRDSAPVLFTPGTDYAYSNPGMAMLSYAVTSALARQDTVDIRTFLRQQIMEPIGIPEEAWSIGYGNTYDINGLPLVANWGGGSFTPRAVARLGRLMLNRGNWQGDQILSDTWVQNAITYHGTAIPDRSGGDPVPASGLCWYTNFDGVWREVPRDAFAGAGAGNQVLLVVPSRNLIAVRMGDDLFEPGGDLTFWGACEKYVFNPIMRAIVEPPYPESEYITGVEFAPTSAIVRQGEGSDNWPITWGDDDVLYTAYGDGWGFQPRTEIKLSLGLAGITGNPPDFRGENIRSESGERVGQGEHGPKASGMLMV
ncbi:MAG TPA: serine hydrolase, partial [bacterium]|nr:serine hydrolase [bacterium]